MMNPVTLQFDRSASWLEWVGSTRAVYSLFTDIPASQGVGRGRRF
jgi:hypothetical protein